MHSFEGELTGARFYPSNRLIDMPLRTLIGGEDPILLAIDALDEREENDAEAVLSILAQEVPQIARLRFFLTSRPEPHILNGPSLRRISIRTSNSDLRPPIWQPTKEQIITATAANFILDRKQVNPAKRLAILLARVSATDFSGSKQTTAIDNVHLGINRAAQPGW